jgi:hypothetical protein
MEAAAWHLLGRMERRRAAFAAAEPDLRQALELCGPAWRRTASSRAATLNNLAILAMWLGDLGRIAFPETERQRLRPGVQYFWTVVGGAGEEPAAQSFRIRDTSPREHR